MRLWHYKLIPHLPRQQLVGQHRECCALRGLGWGKKHSTVDYVFKYSYVLLFIYHVQIMEEMKNRNFNIDKFWNEGSYRGKKLGIVPLFSLPNLGDSISLELLNYPEHNDEYLQECLDNLKSKGIILNIK